MNIKSFSYRQGFKKGLEIYFDNLKNGYFADEDNQRAMKGCKRYADTGYKNDVKLRETQIEFYYGMYDGIRSQYYKHGTRFEKDSYSNFEKREHDKHYGKDSHYDGFGYYD